MLQERRLPILDGWRFMLAPSAEGVREADVLSPSFDDSAWRELNLPHDWQIEQTRDPDDPGGGAQGYFPRHGMGWYRLRFEAPEGWAGKAVRVQFDGVQRNSTVWLNGQRLGSRPYGYVPFIYDLAGALIPGAENTLVVSVDNTQGGADRWYSGAGIYRNVWLLVDEPVHVQPWGVCVTTPEVSETEALVSVAVSVENRYAADWSGTVGLSLVAPDGTLAGTARADISVPGGGDALQCEFSCLVGAPQLWDVLTPALYTATVEVLGMGPGAPTLDACEVRFGIRTARFDANEGFLLNGRCLKLNGVDLHHDGGCLGAAVPLKAWRRRFAVLKEMGCNAIRCSHNPQAEEFYDLADEMGFIVIDELYDKWVGSGLYFNDLFEEWWERDLEAMVLRDRNHPSVVLWSMGNELEIQYQERMYSLLAAMCDKCRALDPTRPVSLALMPHAFGGFDDRTPFEVRMQATLRYAEIVDVCMGNYMEYCYAALKERGLSKAFIGSEVFSYYRHAEGQTTQLVAQSPLLDVNAHDWVAGGFIWAGIDYLGEAANGWPGRGWTGCPIDSAGFRKLRSYHLESQWKAEPVLKLGVLDEGEPWDMAPTQWSFPGMQRHWNYEHKRGRVLRIAAMTNCDEVRLYLNDEPARTSSPAESLDRIAYFHLAWAPGTLRAEGYRGGEKVAQDVLVTTRQAASVTARVSDTCLAADGHDVTHLEVELLDKAGQPYLLSNPTVTFRVDGPAAIAAADNGDFNTPVEIYATDHRRIWNGHALAIVRAGRTAGTVTVTATVDGFAPVSCQLTVG